MTKSTIDVLKDEFFLGDIPKTEPSGIRNVAPSGVREELKRKLSHGSWVIEFIKVNGDRSTMEVTLDPSLLPPAETPVFKEHYKPELESTMRVYSLDRQGWRSFVVGNLIKIYQPNLDL